MEDLNTILSPDAAVVMRAVWEIMGWATVDEICAEIWQSGFSKNKVYKLLRHLEELHFVTIHKRGRQNYYAQRISASQYYPDLQEHPNHFIRNETIEVKGLLHLEKMKKLQSE